MTLIKWPGGKSREIKNIEFLIPKHSRYIEPFFGGGAVFFHLKPNNACINDISEDLTCFYKYVKNNNQKFIFYLKQYNDCWIDIIDLVTTNQEKLTNIYELYQWSDECEGLKNNLESFVNHTHIEEIANKYNIILDKKKFIKLVTVNAIDKYKRTIKNEMKLNIKLTYSDLVDNILTGFLSGVYMYFRSLYNDIQLDKLDNNLFEKEMRIANFYFIREYCYGSMFRYNKNNEFNIPYGGISYNKKNFKAKIDKITSPEIQELFRNTRINTGDFEEFMTELQLTNEDFIFLDPPYDSEFSDYEGRAFDAHDQIRLRNFLEKTRANYILVIKNTEFIFNLYANNPKFNIISFDKQYSYNVKSRNNRDTEHLIITNIFPKND